MRYQLLLSYDGTDYAGWQIQNDVRTVQGVIESCLSTQLREEIRLHGCGRTDAGVHAENYVAHFDASQELPEDSAYHLNAFLPDDIAVHSLEKCADDFHARFDARSRRYRYEIHLQKSPFKNRYSWCLPRAAEFKLNDLQAVLDLLLQYSDFEPFCKSNSGLEHFKCNLKLASWQRDDATQSLQMQIVSNRFLRGMVRLVVGACLRHAEGKLSLDEIRRTMEKQERILYAWSVPARGLFLCEVLYESAA